jgi:hypothetical protein
MPGDLSFEQNFAELAETMLNEKVPALRDDYIGFQLVEKSEDNDNFALGVAAHVLDKKLWIYIPVFFLSGKLKGFDLMFVYQKDMFVPARDNWVSSLKREGVVSLGQPVDRSSSQSSREGGEMFYSPGDARVSDNVFSQKYAAACDDPLNTIFDIRSMALSKEATESAAAMMKNRLGLEGGISEYAPQLQDIALMGKTACSQFAEALMDPEYPELTNALLQFHTPDELQKVAFCLTDTANAAEEHGEEASKLQFITPDMQKEAAELTDKEKRLLLSNGVFVRDERLNFSQVYQAEQDTSVLENPTESGIYDILMSDDGFERMAIVFPEFDLCTCNHLFERSREPFAAQANAKTIAAIPVKSTTSYMPTKSCDIYGRRAAQLSKDDALALKAGAPATRENLLKALKDNYDHVEVLLVNSKTNCALVPLCLHTNRDVENGKEEIVVKRDTYYSPPDRGDDNIRVHFTDGTEGGMLTVEGGTLYIPSETIMFLRGRDYYAIEERKKSSKKEEDRYQNVSYAVDEDSGSVSFGKPEAVRRNVMIKEAAAPLTLFWDGNIGRVHFNKQAIDPLSRMDLLRYLTETQGIQAGMAQNMMNRAQRSKEKSMTVLLKHAAPYDIAAYGDSKPPYMGGPSPRQDDLTREEFTSVQAQTITDNQADPNYRRNVAEEAASRATLGIKEVLDVSVIKAMLSLADIGEVRRDLLSKMMTGMNAFGRMLFYFYYANEHFSERYGDADLKQLETQLRETFVEIGDVILFLREKTESDPMMAESLIGTLSEDIGTSGNG